MAPKILITKFNYSLSHEEFRKLLEDVANDFAQVPGCKWKIWLIDESKNEGGAVYLFEDQKAVDAFKASALVESVMTHPAFSNFELRLTDTVLKPGLLTRAPIYMTEPAIDLT